MNEIRCFCPFSLDPAISSTCHVPMKIQCFHSAIFVPVSVRICTASKQDDTSSTQDTAFKSHNDCRHKIMLIKLSAAICWILSADLIHQIPPPSPCFKASGGHRVPVVYFHVLTFTLDFSVLNNKYVPPFFLYTSWIPKLSTSKPAPASADPSLFIYLLLYFILLSLPSGVSVQVPAPCGDTKGLILASWDHNAS